MKGLGSILAFSNFSNSTNLVSLSVKSSHPQTILSFPSLLYIPSSTFCVSNPHNSNILVPIYSTAYYYKGKEYHILINGQSGVISGEYPKSVFKIVAIVIVIIIIVILAIYYVNS